MYIGDISDEDCGAVKKKIRKYNCIACLTFLATIVLMAMFYITRLSKVFLQKTQVVECESGSEFTSELAKLSGVQVSIDAQDYQGEDIRVRLYDADGLEVLNQSVPGDFCLIWTYGEKFDLPQGKILVPGNHYSLSFERAGKPYKSVTVRLYGEPVLILPYYLTVCCLLLVLELLCLHAFLHGIRHENILAGLVMMLLFALCSIVTPPLGIPDESLHFSAAYYTAGKMLGQDTEKGVPITETGMVRGAGGVMLQEGLNFYTDATGNEVAPEGASYAQPVGSIPLYCYIPAAAGIVTARLLHLHWQWIILLGRLTNGLLAVLITLLSMRILPAGRYAILGFSMLPSCVWLYDSFSYDVWSLSLTMLFVVLILRLRECDRDVHLRDLVLPAVIMLLFVPVKYVYVVLGLSIVLIPRRHWKRKTVLLILIIIILAAAIMLIMRGQEFAEVLTSSRMDTRSNAYVTGQQSYTLGYVAHHPLNTLLVYINTMLRKTQDFADRIISGELYTPLPNLVFVIGLVLIFLIFSCGTRNMEFSNRDKIFAGIIFLLGCIAVYTAFLFVFSGVSSGGIGVIDGMQGRYLLPLLPMLWIVLHSDAITDRMDRLTSEWKISAEQSLWVLLVALNGLCQFFRFLHLASLIAQ